MPRSRGRAVRCIADARQRLIHAAVVLADLVDAARVLSGRDVAIQLARELHLLLDLLHRGHSLAFAAPQVVLDTDADVQPHGDRHRVERQNVAHDALDREHGAVRHCC